MKWILVFVNVILWETVRAGVAPPGSCPVVCACKWKGGKQTVECMDRALITVPEPVDPATQVLDLSGNNLQILPQEAFARTGLVNLQRIYLRNCNIGQIHNRAFKGLTNLVELDLSHNLLTQIPSNSFKDAPFLRDLTIAQNPVLKIHSDALINLGSIVRLDMSKCDIRDIANDAFRNLKLLESLKLNNNKLHDLPLASLEKAVKLRAIDLSDNPWTCDCRLRELKLWLTKHKLISTPSCSAPTRLANRQFSELPIEEFACKPEILPVSRHVEATVGENATVICKTEAIPTPNINWYYNGRLLLNGSHFNSHQKIYIYEDGEHKKKSILVLTNTQDTDPIEIYCMAENKGGNTETNFTIHVTQMAVGMASLGSAQIASLGAAVFLVIVIVSLVLLISFLRLRPEPFSESKTPNTLDRVVSGNEVHPVANERPHVAVLARQDEANDLKHNPVTKPPRINDIPYTTNHYDGRGSVVATGGSLVVSPTMSASINPDLINDTRPDSAIRPGSGEYAREGSDSLYPSGLWEQMKMHQASNLARAISSAIPTFYNDRTPIIENCSVDGSQEELGYSSRTFPRSHVLAAGTTNSSAATADAPYPADYGLPVNGARTLRVWQRAQPVLPPVSTLKRVLTITRPATDDNFQDGRATDV